VFPPFRANDRSRYQKGMPWDAQSLDVVRTLGDATQPAGPGHPSDASVTANPDVDAAAAEARTSSDQGLRRLRIFGAS
jgi:hypothetical protein